MEGLWCVCGQRKEENEEEQGAGRSNGRTGVQQTQERMCSSFKDTGGNVLMNEERLLRR